MASTVMATAKATPSLSSSCSSSSTRKLSIVAQFKPQPTSNLSLKKLLSPKLLLSTIPSIAMIAATTPLPALAEQMEKAKIFDFNLTLPIIAIEFLLLMVALDKLYFTPLGKFMDDRDAKIRAELNEVKDTSAEVKELEEQARAIMRAARAEVAAAANKKMKESTEEMEAQLAEGQARLEIELKEAIAELERQKDEAYTILNAQIEALSDEIVNLVMPNTEELVEEEQVAST